MDEEKKASLLYFRWWRTIGVQASEMAISDLDMKMEINLFSFLGCIYTQVSLNKIKKQGESSNKY